MRFEDTKAFFPDEETLSRVMSLQKEYFIGLTGGEYGEEYLSYCLKIGQVHQRSGLEPRWHMGAYSIYQQLVIPHVLKAFRSDPKKSTNAILALIKIIKLDEELAIQKENRKDTQIATDLDVEELR